MKMNSIREMIDKIRKLNNEGLDDKWIRDDVKVTLRQLLDATKNIQISEIPTNNLRSMVLNWNNNPEEIEKIEKSDLQYPVLVIVNDKNELQYILDGNHRVQKALKYNIPKIKVKLIKLSELPDDFKFVLGGGE